MTVAEILLFLGICYVVYRFVKPRIVNKLKNTFTEEEKK